MISGFVEKKASECNLANTVHYHKEADELMEALRSRWRGGEELSITRSHLEERKTTESPLAAGRPSL